MGLDYMVMGPQWLRFGAWLMGLNKKNIGKENKRWQKINISRLWKIEGTKLGLNHGLEGLG